MCIYTQLFSIYSFTLYCVITYTPDSIGPWLCTSVTCYRICHGKCFMCFNRHAIETRGEHHDASVCRHAPRDHRSQASSS